MLAKTVVGRFEGAAEFTEESWAASELAKRFGVRYYPAVFVNDVLVARPGDFRAKDGRYAPWIGNAQSHDRFRSDLARMVDLAVRGQMNALRREMEATERVEFSELARVPSVRLQPLTGEPLDLAQLDGKVRIAEFWATWCPPCASTLLWLSELQKRHGGRVQTVGIAVESEAAAVRSMADSLGLSYPVVMTSAEIGAAFGDVLSVPTLFIFDKDGRTAAVFYGAPADLHANVERVVERLLR